MLNMISVFSVLLLLLPCSSLSVAKAHDFEILWETELPVEWGMATTDSSTKNIYIFKSLDSMYRISTSDGALDKIDGLPARRRTFENSDMSVDYSYSQRSVIVDFKSQLERDFYTFTIDISNNFNPSTYSYSEDGKVETQTFPEPEIFSIGFDKVLYSNFIGSKKIHVFDLKKRIWSSKSINQFFAYNAFTDTYLTKGDDDKDYYLVNANSLEVIDTVRNDQIPEQIYYAFSSTEPNLVYLVGTKKIVCARLPDYDDFQLGITSIEEVFLTGAEVRLSHEISPDSRTVWYPDDGSVDVSHVFWHTYDKPGNYTIKRVVESNGRLESDSVEIEVITPYQAEIADMKTGYAVGSELIISDKTAFEKGQSIWTVNGGEPLVGKSIILNTDTTSFYTIILEREYKGYSSFDTVFTTVRENPVIEIHHDRFLPNTSSFRYLDEGGITREDKERSYSSIVSNQNQIYASEMYRNERIFTYGTEQRLSYNNKSRVMRLLDEQTIAEVDLRYDFNGSFRSSYLSGIKQVSESSYILNEFREYHDPAGGSTKQFVSSALVSDTSQTMTCYLVADLTRTLPFLFFQSDSLDIRTRSYNSEANNIEEWSYYNRAWSIYADYEIDTISRNTPPVYFHDIHHIAGKRMLIYSVDNDSIILQLFDDNNIYNPTVFPFVHETGSLIVTDFSDNHFHIQTPDSNATHVFIDYKIEGNDIIIKNPIYKESGEYLITISPDYFISLPVLSIGNKKLRDRYFMKLLDNDLNIIAELIPDLLIWGSPGSAVVTRTGEYAYGGAEGVYFCENILAELIEAGHDIQEDQRPFQPKYTQDISGISAKLDSEKPIFKIQYRNNILEIVPSPEKQEVSLFDITGKRVPLSVLGRGVYNAEIHSGIYIVRIGSYTQLFFARQM